MPVARAKPIAAGVPESGIGSTRSASTGASAASRSPIRTRAPCTSTPCEPRVGPREVEELEDAERAVAGLLERLHRVQRRRSSASTSSPGSISRSNLAPTRSSAHVSDATTGSSPSRPSTSGRKPCASRNANSVSSASPTTRRGALEPRHRVRDRVLERRARRRRSAPRSPRSRSSTPSGLPISSRSAVGVDEVAVVAERDRAHAAVVQQRLRVRPGVAAGRRVARVPDRELPLQAGQAPLVEHLRHEPEVAERGQPAVLADTAIPADSWPRCCSAYRPK